GSLGCCGWSCRSACDHRFGQRASLARMMGHSCKGRRDARQHPCNLSSPLCFRWRVRIIAPLFREAPMLLRGLTWLVLFQLLGTALNVLLLPMLPGPIIGLLLLFVALLLRGQASESLQVAASGLLRYLPLLLVPPAVGVMAYTE